MSEQYSIFLEEKGGEDPSYRIQSVEGQYVFSSLEAAQEAALKLPKAMYVFFQREVTPWRICGKFATSSETSF